jgi:hypothetical protein
MAFNTDTALKNDISTKIPDNLNREVSPADVRESLQNIIDQKPNQLKTVGGEGAQYQSIKSAIDSITDSSITKPYVVKINAGVYTEDNPITIPEYVTLIGEGAVIVDAQNNSSDIFIVSSNAFVKNITVQNATSGTAFVKTSATSALLEDVTIIQCDKGVTLNNAAGTLTVRGLTLLRFSGSMTSGIEVIAGNLVVENVRVGDTTGVGSIIKASGINSVITATNTLSFSPTVVKGINITTSARAVINNTSIVGATDGVFIEDGVNVRLNSVTIFNSQTDAIRVGSGGSTVTLAVNGCTFLDSTNKDFNCLRTGSTIQLLSAILDISKAFIVDGTFLYGSFVNSFGGDEGTNIEGELHVGNPIRPSESVFGEGDSYVNGMKVYTYNGSAYANVSTAAASSTGSTFTFPNTNVNTAIYIASSLQATDYIKHSGIKVLLESLGDIGSGEIVTEYWNGASWAEFNSMVTESSAPYFPYAKNYFQQLNSQIRYNPLMVNDNWTKNDDPSDGQDLYWIRFRIKTSITTSPVFQQIKLHSSRMEINSDGWPEYFGNSRPIGLLPWDLGLAEAAAASPLDQDLYISDNLDIGRRENLFSNTATDRIGFNAYLPLDLDTSSPIRLRFSLVTDDNSGGNIDWVVRWGYTTDGDSVYPSQAAAPATGPNEQNITQSIAAPTVSNQQATIQFNLDVSTMVSRRSVGFGDIIWVTLQRTSGDTHGGDVALLNLQAFYTKWCNGGHLEN